MDENNIRIRNRRAVAFQKLQERPRTEERKEGGVWFFKDNYRTADNGLDTKIEFGVWELS